MMYFARYFASLCTSTPMLRFHISFPPEIRVHKFDRETAKKIGIPELNVKIRGNRLFAKSFVSTRRNFPSTALAWLD